MRVLFCPGKNFMQVWLYIFAALVLVYVDVMVMSFA